MGIVYLITKSVLLDMIVTTVVVEAYAFYRLFTEHAMYHLLLIIGFPLFMLGCLGLIVHGRGNIKSGRENE